LAVDGELDLSALRQHMAANLPSYARPVFVRLRTHADLTGTFKYSKMAMLREGFEPDLCSDPLYFDSAEADAFVPMNRALYQRIQSGGFRL